MSATSSIKSFSAESIATPIVNTLVATAGGYITGGLIGIHPVSAAIFCASAQIIKEVFDKAIQYLPQVAEWTKKDHKDALLLLSLAIHSVALVGGLKITAMITSIALPIIDAIVLVIIGTLVCKGTAKVLDACFGPKQ